MQILELSTGGHKVESMKWNGETVYKQRLPFDTYVYTANASTPFDFSTYDFLDFSHLNPELIVASGMWMQPILKELNIVLIMI